MKEAMIHNLPTEETLKHLAISGEVAQITTMLATLRPETTAPDLFAKLEVLNTQLELQQAFVVARGALHALQESQPISLAEDTELAEAVDNLPAGTASYGDAISSYLHHIRADVGSVFSPDAEPQASERQFGRLQHDLVDEQARPATLKRLAALSPVSKQWLQERAASTVESVTENLWEVVATGRDVAALAAVPDTEEARLQLYVTDWRNTAASGFSAAGQELDSAITWLSGEQPS